jgi:hypothetical protein
MEQENQQFKVLLNLHFNLLSYKNITQQVAECCQLQDVCFILFCKTFTLTIVMMMFM